MPNLLKKITLTINTIRHLTFTQLLWQMFYRIVSKLKTRSLALAQKNVLLPKTVSPKVSFVPPTPVQNGELPQTGQLVFLNRTHKLGWPPQWQQPNLPKLWQYNLHYHDFIWDLTFEESRTAVTCWIKECTFESGRVEWRPYPTSLRITNWVKYFFGNYRSQTFSDQAFLNKLIYSLSLQAIWLLKRIEYHLLANHLLENATALCTIGAFFDGPLAQTCKQKGWRILKDQLPTQILEDGGHFERSAMYHCRLLYCLLDLYNACDNACQEVLLPYIQRMCSWLLLNCHPDGQIQLFNDAAMNVYLHPVKLQEYAKSMLPETSQIFDKSTMLDRPFACPSSGYYGWVGNEGTYLICDAAPLGPDYCLAHGHADIFGFELSVYGQRVIVDTGTFSYDVGENRAFTRSTAAHNTVEIDGKDQSEMWYAFRVARRGKPYDVQFHSSNDGFVLSGWHDGYKRLSGRPVHERKFEWNRSGMLKVRDKVVSRKKHRVVSRVHMHPYCEIRREGPRVFQISWPGGSAVVTTVECKDAVIGQYDYAPEFGRKFIAPFLSLTPSENGKVFGFDIVISTMC